MTAWVRVSVASHAAAFAAGVWVGKSIDADELALYRDAHEGTFSKALRRAQTWGLIATAAGTLLLVARVAVKASSSRNVE